jgi:hypothetical protein
MNGWITVKFVHTKKNTKLGRERRKNSFKAEMERERLKKEENLFKNELTEKCN